MRIFIWRLKTALTTLFALVFVFVALLITGSANICRFSGIEGERTFYLDSASSQGLRTDTLSIRDLTRVRGESVRFVLEENVGGAQGKAMAEEIAKRYEATILFMEEACGTVSYYGYTPRFSDGVWVNGRKINLHIAFGNGVGAVGSPIIFDGF